MKVWTRADLKAQGQFWYDNDQRALYVYSGDNPAKRYGSVECALYRHIINEGGASYVTYENLALRYGAAHGIGGGSTHHIIARGLDISFIGGAYQEPTLLRLAYALEQSMKVRRPPRFLPTADMSRHVAG